MLKVATVVASQHVVAPVLSLELAAAVVETVGMRVHLLVETVAPAAASFTISVREALNDGISDFKRRRSYQYHRS